MKTNASVPKRVLEQHTKYFKPANCELMSSETTRVLYQTPLLPVLFEDPDKPRILSSEKV